MSVVLEARDLHKQYESNGYAVLALNGVSMQVRAGEFVVLMGASGSGKSTLLHLLAGLDQPTSGSVRIEEQDIGRLGDRRRTLFRRRRLGVIFQAYNLLPTLTALENVMLPSILDGGNGQKALEKGKELLRLVGLSERMEHRPQALSGGEQQRVAIARALANDPAVILADEPTGNLDTRHAELIWKQFAQLVREHSKTIVAVTHEPTGATYADRVLILKDGGMVGEFQPGGEGHASFVATRYTELVS